MTRGSCNRASDGRRQHNRVVIANEQRYGHAQAFVSGANALAVERVELTPTLRLVPKLNVICNGLVYVGPVEYDSKGRRRYPVFLGKTTAYKWPELRLVTFWAKMHKWFEWEAADTVAPVTVAPRLLPAPPTFPMLTAQALS